MSETIIITNENYDELVWSVNAKTLMIISGKVLNRDLINVQFDKIVIDDIFKGRILKHRATATYSSYKK